MCFVKDGDANHNSLKTKPEPCICVSIPSFHLEGDSFYCLLQCYIYEHFLDKIFSCSNLLQLFAEILGTYFLIFVGYSDDFSWGLIVMVMIYSVGHVSGAHFNPAVTVSFAASKRFP